jgi:hypothetical protein
MEGKMKKTFKPISAVSMLLVFAVNVLAASLEVNVTDSDGSYINGAQVVVICFDEKGEPGADNTHLAVVDNAAVNFDLQQTSDYKPYILHVTAQGYAPTVKDQMMGIAGPAFDPVHIDGSDANITRVIIMNSITNVGKIEAEVTLPDDVPLPTFIFGGVMMESTGEDIAFGLAKVEGSTTIMGIYNIAVSQAYAYNCGAFCPAANLQIGTKVTEAIINDGEVVVNLDFRSSEAMAPEKTDNSRPEPSGNVAFKGVIQNSNSEPVLGAQVEVEGRRINEWGHDEHIGRWHTNSDGNGCYVFYDLPGNASYYFFIGSSGYKGINYSGAEGNGVEYDGVNTKYVHFTPKENRALETASGKIIGKVTLNAAPVPYGHVNAWGDDTRWHGSDNFATGDLPEWQWCGKPGPGHGDAEIRNGEFAIHGLPDGNYRLNIWTDFSYTGSIRINEGENAGDDFEFCEYGGKNSTHSVAGDDIRITVDNGDCRVYKADGSYISNNVVVEIPAQDIPDSAVIYGKIELVGSSNIDPDSPVTIIAHQDWSTFSHEGEVPEYAPETTAASIDEFNNVYIQLANKRVEMVNYVKSMSGGDILFNGHWWHDYDKGRVYWDSNHSSKPEEGDSVMVSYRYQNIPQTGFTTVSGNGTDFPFSINVKSGYKYELEIKSADYGVNWNEDVHDLYSDFSMGEEAFYLPAIKMSPAGSIKGIIRLPNMQVFKPMRWEEQAGPDRFEHCEVRINIDAEGKSVNSWGWSDVNDDGTFTIEGLLPGRYNLRTHTNWWPEIGGEKVTWSEGTLKDITVSTGTTSVVIYLKEGVDIMPDVDLSSVLSAEVASYFYDWITSGEHSKSHYEYRWMGGIGVIGFPSGTSLNAKELGKTLMHAPEISMGYNHLRLQPHPESSWERSRIAPGEYDFYLGATAKFDPWTGREDMFTIFLGQKRGVEITKSNHVDISFDKPIIGNATLKGNVSGRCMFSEEDLYRLKNSFEEEIGNLIPSILFYDSNNNLRAFTMGVPSSEGATQYEKAIKEGDLERVEELSEQYPLRYKVKFLPAGTYTLVAVCQNYPPYSTQVTVSRDEVRILNLDFDEDVGVGATVRGEVKDAGGNPISGATVRIVNRFYEKKITTGEDGKYSVEGLAKGLYKIEVQAGGYAPAVCKQGVSDFSSYSVSFTLIEGTEYFSGTVYSQRLPYPKVYEGAKIVAFDESYNEANPDAMLPLYKAVTDSNGKYEINGLISGHHYNIFVVVPGKRVEAIKRLLAGVITGVDFALKDVLPAFNVKFKASDNEVKFKIKSIKTLIAPPAVEYTEGDTFEGTAINVPAHSASVSSDTWKCSVALNDDNIYTLRIKGSDGKEEKHVDLRFGLGVNARARVLLDEYIAMGGDVEIDDTGTDPSIVTIPVDGLEVEEEPLQATSVFSAAITFSKQTGDAGSEEGLISDMYEVELENASIKKNLTLTLAYDRTKVGPNDSGVSICQYISGEWRVIEGVTTVDPLNGTVSISISSLSGISGSSMGASSVSSQNVAQNSKFAVFNSLPNTNITYSSGEFKMYNFPNPFDLKTKTVTLSDGTRGALTANQTVTGTMLKYYLPSAHSGSVKFYVYNIAGELVRTIDDGNRDGGYIYYCEWDGKTDSGENCASGVYLLLPKVENSKIKINGQDKALKMAVIK